MPGEKDLHPYQKFCVDFLVEKPQCALFLDCGLGKTIITLTAMLLLGKKEAGIVLLLRIIMGAMFTGSPAALIYSISGGVLAYIVMCLLVGRFPEKLIWVVSAAAAVAHNAGQLMACALIVKTPGLLYYAPVLAASGIITGVFTGVAAMYLVRAVRKIIKK